MVRTLSLLFFVAFAILVQSPGNTTSTPANANLLLPSETHLRNARQLTFSGENAEAYFSADDRWIIFQSKDAAGQCDQIYVMDIEGKQRRQLSTGGGKTTCSYIFPDGKHILYASTRGAGPACPPPPDYSRGYVWKMYFDFDIYIANRNGSEARALAPAPGYDAEATISRNGKKIVFTSMRDGDLDIYTMDAKGKNLKRLTHETGYDGGPFFSADGKKIVYRANHPKTPEEIAEYRQLLTDGVMRPRWFEIWVMDADGSHKKQLTDYGAASFAPFFHPDGKRIIFGSNMHDPRGRNFDLYLINVDGTGLERVTYHETFDSFPMFTSDGKKLVWASNRNASKQGDTNIFIADWVD